MSGEDGREEWKREERRDRAGGRSVDLVSWDGDRRCLDKKAQHAKELGKRRCWKMKPCEEKLRRSAEGKAARIMDGARLARQGSKATRMYYHCCKET